MKVKEVDSFDTKPFQRCFNGRPDIFGLPISFVSAYNYAAFGGQEDFVASSGTFEP